jgi:hypothetical protein
MPRLALSASRRSLKADGGGMTFDAGFFLEGDARFADGARTRSGCRRRRVQRLLLLSLLT